NAITVEAWVKLTSPFGTAAIIGRQFGFGTTSDSFGIGLRPNFFFGVTDVSGTPYGFDTNVTLPLNEWHHVAGTWDGAVLRMYLDGNEIGSTPYTGTIGYPVSNPVFIGADEDGTSGVPDIGFVPGNVDEVRISNVALTPAQFLNAPPTFTHFNVS